MAASKTIEILNRVLLVHNRSLPQYLHDAAPWLRPNEERCQEALDLIVRDQRQTVDRIGAFIEENGGIWDLGEYPMAFTGYHDVSFDWLLPLMIDRQKKTILYLERCAAELSLAPMAKALVEETVGMAKGHLEALEELQRDPAPVAAH